MSALKEVIYFAVAIVCLGVMIPVIRIATDLIYRDDAKKNIHDLNMYNKAAVRNIPLIIYCHTIDHQSYRT